MSHEDFVQGLLGMPELMALVQRMPVTTGALRKLLPLQQQLRLEDKLKPRHVPLDEHDKPNKDEGGDKFDKEAVASMREVSALDVLKHLPGRYLQWQTVDKIISSGKKRAISSADTTAAATATELGVPDTYHRNRNPPSSTMYILQQCVVLSKLPGAGEWEDVYVGVDTEVEIKGLDPGVGRTYRLVLVNLDDCKSEPSLFTVAATLLPRMPAPKLVGYTANLSIIDSSFTMPLMLVPCLLLFHVNAHHMLHLTFDSCPNTDQGSISFRARGATDPVSAQAAPIPRAC